MKNRIQRMSLGCCILMASALAGCSHTKVHKELMVGVKKVGLLSITVDKLGKTDSDFRIVQNSADFATQEYSKLLAMNPRWEFVPVSQYQNHPAFKGFHNFAESPLVRAQLQKLMEQGKLKPADMANAMRYAKAQLFGNKEEMQQILQESIPGAAKMLQVLLDQKRQPYLAARGLAFIPYDAVKPEGGSNKVTIKAGDGANEKEPEEELRDLLFATIGALAQELGLDAMAIVHQRAAVTSTVGVGVIIGDRGLDTIRMGPTVMLITKEGKKAVDMGYPSMDSLAYSRMAVPVYKRVGEHGRELDLNDPKGKVGTEFNALVGESALGILKDMEDEFAKK